MGLKEWLEAGNKCQECGAKVVPYPLKKDGKFIWQNLFKMDVMSTAFIILILVFVVAYAHDTSECRSMMEQPCDYFNTSCYNYALYGDESSGVMGNDFGIERINFSSASGE